MVGYPLELWTGKPGERCKEVFRFMEGVYRHARAEEEEREEVGGSVVGWAGCVLWAILGEELWSTDSHTRLVVVVVQGGSSAGVSLPPFALWDERMTTVEAREALAAAGRMREFSYGWID